MNDQVKHNRLLIRTALILQSRVWWDGELATPAVIGRLGGVTNFRNWGPLGTRNGHLLENVKKGPSSKKRSQIDAKTL